MASTYAILKKQDVLKDKIDRDSLFCYLSGVYPINISKKLEDIIKDYVLHENFYAVNKVATSILNAVEGTDLLEERFNVSIMQWDIALLMGDEQAEQFIRLLAMYGRQFTKSYSLDLYEKLIENKSASIKDLIAMIVLFITFMYNLKEIDSWYRSSAFRIEKSYRDAISYTSGSDKLDVKPEDVASAGILEDLPLEDKRNIIGSLWNCIIDIIVDKNINGERSEQ